MTVLAGESTAARAAALAWAPLADDGTLASRLAAIGVPDVAAAMLGRDLTDPHTVVAPAVAEQSTDARGLIAALVDVRGAVAADELAATVDALAAVQALVNRAQAVAALLLERARRQAMRAPDLLVDGADPHAALASAPRRRELAHRAVVADVAVAVCASEDQVADWADRAQALVAKAPRTLGAAVTGAVPWANARVVARAVADLSAEAADEVDRALAGPATATNGRRLRARARRVREQVHPTPVAVRHEEATAKRYVALDPGADGMAHLHAYLPAPAAHAVFDRLTRTGRAARADGDGRTLAQLRADALVDLSLDDGTLDLAAAHEGTLDPAAAHEGTLDPAAAHEGTPDPTTAHGDAPGRPPVGTGSLGPGGAPAERPEHPPHGPPDHRFHLARLARSIRPHVTVTVPALTLLGRAEEPGLLDGVTPIGPDAARELAGLAGSFTRLLTDPERGVPLSVGRRAYTPPAGLQRWVALRDATCRFPGCTRPAHTAEADHTVAWADGGHTAAGNLATLCRHHHQLKHQTRWQVRQTTAGTLEWTSPTGRRTRTRPEPPPATVHTPDQDLTRLPGRPPDDIAGWPGEPPF
ncbi:DUF222 domain-containing protein [Puerhibacterium sp. TATVAM-FAB25]|uniref:DUF222 domain-containing protein n=1 Tax=Puerhibacterium sp. TATVAM-FAB25 TaxID=3093699 RepID=UPI003978CDE4